MRLLQLVHALHAPLDAGAGIAQRRVPEGIARCQNTEGIEHEQRARRRIGADGFQHAAHVPGRQVHAHAFQQQEQRLALATRQAQLAPPVIGRQIHRERLLARTERGQQPIAQRHHLGQVGVRHAGGAVVQPLEILAQPATDVDEMGLGIVTHETLGLLADVARTGQHAPHAVAVLDPAAAVIADGCQRGCRITIVHRHLRKYAVPEGAPGQRDAQGGGNGL